METDGVFPVVGLLVTVICAVGTVGMFVVVGPVATETAYVFFLVT